MAKYGVKAGQVYVAASGGKYGHLVVDAERHAHVDDVVVIAFGTKTIDQWVARIDSFKLTSVRYYLIDGELPAWVPESVRALSEALLKGETP